MKVVGDRSRGRRGDGVGGPRGPGLLRPPRDLRGALPGWPRHVEMQILADTHGHTLWLGERDCSAQRRHQKLVEESPAPDFPDDVRRAMGEAAVKVPKPAATCNAGTVEFLFQDGEFYFLEMNTRLQVEHPVTELVTGLDLVAWQIRVASASRSTFTQDDVEPTATPSRSASTPRTRPRALLPFARDASPSSRPRGPGVRLDAGYEAGDTVSQFYDNLVAKLIVWAPDREAARRRDAARARGDGDLGVATTVPAIRRHPRPP